MDTKLKSAGLEWKHCKTKQCNGCRKLIVKGETGYWGRIIRSTDDSDQYKWKACFWNGEEHQYFPFSFPTLERAENWVERKLLAQWSRIKPRTALPQVTFTVTAAQDIANIIMADIQKKYPTAKVSNSVALQYKSVRTYTMSDEQREAISVRMTQVWAERRELKKANDELIDTLTKQVKGKKYLV